MGCGPLQLICNAVSSVVGGASSAVASAGFGAIASSFADAAKTMCDWMWSAISTTTTVDLAGGWFTSDLAITGEIAATMISALFVLQLIKGALQRDPHALGRAVTGCGIAFLGAGAAVLITETLLILTDQLSNGVVHTAGMGDLASMGRKMTPVVALSAGAFTPALVIALSFFYVLASVLVWAVFIIRKAMIIVAAVFAPVAFGGAATDATRHWVRKWIEFTVAMVFSKLVIVLIFTIAISLIGTSGSGWHGLSNLMTGLLLLVMACFAPWLVFKLVHYIGGDIVAAHHAEMISDAKTAGGTAVAATGTMKGSAQKVFASSGQSSAAGTAGASAGVGAAVVPAAAMAGAVTAPTRIAAAADRIGQGATSPQAGPAPNGPSPAASPPAAASSEPTASASNAGLARNRAGAAPSVHGIDWSAAT